MLVSVDCLFAGNVIGSSCGIWIWYFCRVTLCRLGVHVLTYTFGLWFQWLFINFFFYSICGGIFVYLIFLLAPGLPVSSWWCWNKHKKLPQSGPPGAYKRGEELWPVERQHDSWAGFCLWWDSVCHCHPLCICIVVRMSNVPPPLNLQYCIAFIYICPCWRLCFHGVFFSLVIIQCTVWELLILYLPVSCRELRCTNRNYFLDLWGLLPFFLFVFVSIHSFWHSFLILLGFTWQPVIFVWNSPQ